MNIKESVSAASVCLLFIASFLIGSIGFAATAHADAEESNDRSYMQVYSEKGTYSKAKIELLGPDRNDAKVCAGKKLLGSNSYQATKKLSVKSKVRFRCSAVGGSSMYYRVSFYKGARGEASKVYSNIALQNNACVVITPHGGPVASNKTCSTATDPGITAHDFKVTTSITATTGVSTRPAISGKIVVQEVAAGDTDSNVNVSRFYCSASTLNEVSYPAHKRKNVIKYVIKETGTGNIIATRVANLRYVKNDGGDRCEAKLSRTRLSLKSATNYTVTAQDFAGNAYFNRTQTNQVATFTTK